MYIGLLHIHSFLRWILLFLLLASIIKAFSGMSGKISFTEKDRKRTLFTLISAHIQAVLGLVLYFVSPNVQQARMDMAAAMKDPLARFLVVEHLAMMVVAVVFITIGNAKAKKAKDDAAKFKAIAIWFTIGLLIILAAIPWPFREIGQGRGWF